MSANYDSKLHHLTIGGYSDFVLRSASYLTDEFEKRFKIGHEPVVNA